MCDPFIYIYKSVLHELLKNTKGITKLFIMVANSLYYGLKHCNNNFIFGNIIFL